MAKPPGERQCALRTRRSRARIGEDVPERDRSEGEQRLDVWIRTSAALALDATARRRGPSRRHALEQILMEAGAAEDEAGVTG